MNSYRIFIGSLMAGYVSLCLLCPAPFFHIVWLLTGGLVCLGVIIMQRNLDIREPIIMIGALAVVYYLIAPLFWLFSGTSYFYGIDVTKQIPGLVMVAISISLAPLCVTLLDSWRPRVPAEMPRPALRIGGICLCGLSVACFYLYFALSGIAYVDRMGILPQLGEGVGGGTTYGFLLACQDVGLPGLAMLSASERGRPSKVLIGVTLILGFIALTTGFRSKVIKIIGAVLIERAIRPVQSPRLGVVVLALVVGVGLFSAMGNLRGGSIGGGELTAAETFSLDSILGDTNVTQVLAVAFERVPESEPYLFGASIPFVAIQFLPRAWFEDKPFAPEIEMVWAMTDKASGYAAPFHGGWYLNFGWLGILIASLALGIICVRASRLLRHHRSSPDARIIFTITYLYCFLIFPRHYFAEWAWYLLYLFGPYLFSRWVNSWYLRGFKP